MPLPLRYAETVAPVNPVPVRRMKPAPETGAAGSIGGSISHPATTGSQNLKVYPIGVVSIYWLPFSVSTPTGKRIVEDALDLEGGVFVTVEGEIIAEYHWPTADTS